MARRFGSDFSQIVLHRDRLNVPLRWRRPGMVFVNSVSDLFHSELVPFRFVDEVFDVMARCPRHTFQILTKRPIRMREYPRVWPDNVWAGTSVENADYLWRVDELREVDARVRFLSLEPLLGPIPTLDLSGIHWVIVGGETGPHHRPMRKAWVVQARNICERANVPFFFKQWGGVSGRIGGRVLDGRTWDGLPTLPVVSTA